MDALLYIGLVPVTVGGLAMYLKLSRTWLRILGLAMFGGGLLCYTLHGHKLRFFKELKTQRQQRIQVRLVSGLRLTQTL